MCSRRFSEEERRWLTFHFVKHGYRYVKDNWQLHFSTELPSRRSLYRYQRKLKSEKSLKDKHRSGRPRTVQTEETITTVCQSVVEQNPTSTRRLARQLDISQTSVVKILKANKFRPYIAQKVHELLPHDSVSRLKFCSTLLSLFDQDSQLFDRLIWTDEAIFKLSGTENRNNTTFWSTTNPHAVSIHKLNQPGLTVWAGVCSLGIIGPFFFEETVSGQSYLNMLNNFIIPQVNQIDVNMNLIYQHDGAPGHFDRRVRQRLRERFGDRFVGRGASIEMPPRSPDITPMDYAIWGIVKDNVYSRKPATLDELKNYIIFEFNVLNNNLSLLTKIVNSVYGRLWNCIIAEGKQFEHLL